MSTPGMFFIVGSARSGTTLLRMMLNAHPDVGVPPESRFVVDLYRRDEVVVDEFLSALGAHRRWTSWKTPIEDVRAQLAEAATVDYAAAIEAAYAAWAHNRDKKRYGDKTPRYIEHLGLLSRLWPRGKFVHLLRDGRDVALSYAGVPFGPNTVAKAAALWKERVLLGLNEGRPLGPERYLELRYERLLENPREEAERLCRFLELDFDPAMLDFSERSQVEVLDRAKLYNPNVTRSITKTRSWSEQMPRAQVEVFEAVAGDTLSELGYERLFPSPRLGARISSLAGRAGLPVGHLAHKNNRGSVQES
ncbi:MAG: sulfotransferase family protein [Actinomycetota bacterium]